MSNFSFKRLGCVLRRDIAENIGAYSRFLGILAFIIMLMEIILHPGYPNQRYYTFEPIFACLALWCFLSISFAFHNLGKKQNRISYLLLPATNLEKFLSRLLLYTVGVWIGIILAFAVGDTLRMLITPLIFDSDKQLPSMLPDMFKFFWNWFDVGQNIHSRFSEMSATVGAAFVVHAAYLLGSCIFKKKGFVVTTVLLIAITATVGKIVVACTRSISFGFIADEISNITMIYATIEFIVAALLYWLSYKAFTRIQVIPKKLFK